MQRCRKLNELVTAVLATRGGIGIWCDTSNKYICKPVVTYVVLYIYKLAFIFKKTVKMQKEGLS